MKVTVMGLGLNGGGLASALYFAKRGDDVTVTDLRDEAILAPAIEQLKDYPIHYVLGEHRNEDFQNADCVIKNPAVKWDSPFLKQARSIETDITVFLRQSRNPLIAVTGSKGKSTTVSALFHILKECGKNPHLGGNITVSPLTFIDEALTDPDSPVILELSSWQLADIHEVEKRTDSILLKPRAAVITNILHDHQNAYSCFEDYVADKALIYRNQTADDRLMVTDDAYGRRFAEEAHSRVFFVDAVDDAILPSQLKVPGSHSRDNIRTAAQLALWSDCTQEAVYRAAASFAGVPFRLENRGTVGKITFYNDSAATMPDAMLAACRSFNCPVYLITGGTDKNLILSPFDKIPENVRHISLLDGSATKKALEITELKNRCNTPPFRTMKEAFADAFQAASLAEEPSVLLLSPGAASFELFLNEFDRGRQFNNEIRLLS